jgi:poly(A) polymerase
LKNSGIQQTPEPKIIPRASHNVSRADISKNALKVLYRLHNAGFEAFLVGGSVRDALLGLHPKDFDIATNAHPDEVKALFGNCRLIGRRFRLAHVRFGREIIEVATFRAGAIDDPDAVHDREGRILRDNVYGRIDEDVWRRDFTCNALYYNIADFSIWDYVGGVDDIRASKLLLIGDADQRLREDPVRMLRAVRFAAKLGFDIDTRVADAMASRRDSLRNVPPARLFDEFVKMFQAGFAERAFVLLQEHRLFEQLFPETQEALDLDPRFRKFVSEALRNTDKRVAEGKSVTPMFLLGVFLWVPVRQFAERLRQKDKMSEPQSLAIAAQELASLQQSRISLPRRYTAPMRDMLALQPRFIARSGRRAIKLLEHKSFRAAYDFMMLRAEVGEVDRDTASFWTDVQTRSAEERQASFGVGGNAIDKGGKPGGKGGKKRRRPRRRRSAGSGNT